MSAVGTGRAAARTARPRRTLHVVLAVVLALAALIVLGLGYLGTEAGHAHAARILESRLSAAVAGSFRIEAIERLGFFEPAVRGLEIRDPQGELALRVDRAMLDIDPLALLRGELIVPWASATGGTVVIEIAPNGKTTLENALAGPPQKSSKSASEEDGVVMDWQHIDVSGVAVDLRLSQGERSAKLVQVRGTVRIERPAREAVKLRLEQVRGRATTPELLGNELRLTHVHGWVHGAAAQLMELALRGRLGDGHVEGLVKLHARDDTPVEVWLQPSGGIETELAAQLVNVRSWMADAVSVEIGEPPARSRSPRGERKTN